ncbi:hypothetical protein ACEWY4_007045 [Coilia grayii]|uniref:KIAA0040 n=1 Tax=Coilia grayii TaxID=363190 RepID=A0ABD1KFI3_9TELE
MQEEIRGFFMDLWTMATTKHDLGAYNTVCLVVLLVLPLVVFFTMLVVCCHCCCCRHDSCCRCCSGKGADGHRSEKRRKKNGPSKNEDLWISVKSGPLTPDVVGLTHFIQAKAHVDMGPDIQGRAVVSQDKRSTGCQPVAGPAL